MNTTVVTLQADRGTEVVDVGQIALPCRFPFFGSDLKRLKSLVIVRATAANETRLFVAREIGVHYEMLISLDSLVGNKANRPFSIGD